MKNGVVIAIDTLDGCEHVAVIKDGVLQDILRDSPAAVAPEAVFLAKPSRDLHAQKAMIVDLGAGVTGFLKYAGADAPSMANTPFLVQIKTTPSEDKAAPVTQKILLKGGYVILALKSEASDKTEINISKSIVEPALRDSLKQLIETTLQDLDPPHHFAVILRTAAGLGAADEIAADLRQITAQAQQIKDAAAQGKAGLLLPAPSARTRAMRDFYTPQTPRPQIIDEPACFERLGIHEQLDALETPRVPLPNGARMVIEPTSALIAVDVDTGGDLSGGAGAKANLACAAELPRQLRLRALGGQIVIDPAPMPKRDRVQFERALHKAFSADSVPTERVGWTKLGHFELQRKRS